MRCRDAGEATVRSEAGSPASAVLSVARVAPPAQTTHAVRLRRSGFVVPAIGWGRRRIDGGLSSAVLEARCHAAGWVRTTRTESGCRSPYRRFARHPRAATSRRTTGPRTVTEEKQEWRGVPPLRETPNGSRRSMAADGVPRRRVPRLRTYLSGRQRSHRRRSTRWARRTTVTRIDWVSDTRGPSRPRSWGRRERHRRGDRAG